MRAIFSSAYEADTHYSLKAATSKFKRMCKLKINKPKGGYASKAGLVFQSWLKDIRTLVEDSPTI